MSNGDALGPRTALLGRYGYFLQLDRRRLERHHQFGIAHHTYTLLVARKAEDVSNNNVFASAQSRYGVTSQLIRGSTQGAVDHDGGALHRRAILLGDSAA
ncbi:MAG: hypothetical protein IPG74_12515 [Flavobacteriales bacterium]|nr:hypothetical protein [Flavobacteriales bacterium]